MEYTRTDEPATEHGSPEEAPEELRELRQWVCWCWALRDGEWTKHPLDPKYTNRKARTDDPRTWGDYETAVSRYEAREDVAGVGFVFTEADPYCGVDYDDCRDPVTGELHPQVVEDLEALGSYAEVSPSGKGIKTIIRGRKPGPRCRTGDVPWGGKIELYDRDRFFTVTGSVLESHDLVTDSQEAVEKIYRRSFPPPTSDEPLPPRSSGGSLLEDEELLRKARNSRHGAGFWKLYAHGDVSGYPSHSEADFALLGRLAFWTRQDPQQMQRLFIRSKLYRQEKGRDYVERSVASSLLRYQGAVYDPDGATKEAKGQVLAGMWAPLFTDEWMGMTGATDHNLYCALLIEASESGIPRRDGSINTTPGTEGLAKRAGTTQKTAIEGLKRLKERGLVDVLPKTRARAREVIVVKPETRVYSTKIHTGAGELSAVDLCEFGGLLRLRWGRDSRAAFQRVGKVAGLFLHWLLVFRQGLSPDVLAECTGRRRDSVVRYLKRLGETGLVTRDGDLWRLPADFWERLATEIEENCATSERLQEQGAERAKEAREYHESPEAPAAGDVPPDMEEERLRRAGWEPLVVRGSKLWRHPRAMGWGAMERADALEIVHDPMLRWAERRRKKLAEPCIHDVPHDPSMRKTRGECWLCRKKEPA
jgi:hypothetical protein